MKESHVSTFESTNFLSTHKCHITPPIHPRKELLTRQLASQKFCPLIPTCLFVIVSYSQESQLIWFGAGMKDKFLSKTRDTERFLLCTVKCLSCKFLSLWVNIISPSRLRLVWKLDWDCVRNEVWRGEGDRAASRDGRSWTAALPDLHRSSVAGDQGDVVRKIFDLGVQWVQPRANVASHQIQGND